MTDAQSDTPSSGPEPITDEPGVKRPDQKGSGQAAETPAKPSIGPDGAAGSGGKDGFGTDS